MTITKDEQDKLFAELGEALNCTIYPDSAENLRLALWNWLDQRRAKLNPPQDRRSVAARKHRADIAAGGTIQ